MTTSNLRKTFVDPLVDSNPVGVQVLGICSALAVTTRLETAVVMSAALTTVLTASNVTISVLRRSIPPEARIIVQLTVIASLVILTDQVLRAYLFETSKQLSVFVGLIITNCIVMGRAEAFAMKHGPRASLVDGLGNGAGYSLVLLTVGAVRELLGAGRIGGIVVLPTVDEGGWYEPNRMMALAPAAFLMIAALIWIMRTVRPGLVEAEPTVVVEADAHPAE